MSKSPLDIAKEVMSGKTTRKRVEAADALMIPTKPKLKRKPKVQAPVIPQTKFVNARERQIAAARAKDRADIIAMNKKNSLRNRYK